jgi:urea carboxylase-associated protein 1
MGHAQTEVVDGTVVEDQVIPADSPWARVIPRGAMLRIVDLEGKQAVDFLCYSAQDPSERYNAADTMKYAGTIFLTRGHALWSDMGRKLFTIVEDTCGRHDTIGGCCSSASNQVRYGISGTPNCRDNFLRALVPFGLGRKDVVANVNFFMNVPVEPDGRMGIAEGLSHPGDFVDLRAEMDVLAVISNCPQTRNPCNGYNPTPIRLVVWQPDAPASSA